MKSPTLAISPQCTTERFSSPPIKPAARTDGGFGPIWKTLTVTIASTLISGGISSAALESEADDASTAAAREELRQQAEQVRDQVRQAKDQIKEASKAWKDASRAVGAARAAVAGGEDDTFEDDGEDSFHGLSTALAAMKDKVFSFAGPARPAARPLIIGKGEPDASLRTEIEEDLTVMSRILTRSISGRAGRDEHEWAMGIALSSIGGGKRPEAIYLEGYGALFLANVKFPLVAPPKKEAEKKKQEEESDSEWEQTKDELFGDRKMRRHGPFIQPLPGVDGPRMEYGADRVADLKKKVFEALKNGSNIRHLQPEEWITVAITGPDNASGAPVRGTYRNENHSDKSNLKGARMQFDVVVRADKVPSGEETYLVVRAKKADVDAFASGKLTAEDFESKAFVAAY